MAMSFLKTGSAVHEEVVKADQAAKERFSNRFFMKEGEEARITFLDGELAEGLLQTVSYYEHLIPKAGRKGFDNFPCTQEQEPCPICEDGEVPALCFAFTILDHRIWKDRNDKTHQHEKRLYVCKRETFKRLQKKAEKYGGLVGVTFDVTRIGDKSASVGSDYDHVDKNDIETIAASCGLKLEDCVPLNYEESIKYYTAEELRGMGFGAKPGPGSSKDMAAMSKAAGTEKPAETKAAKPGGTFGTKTTFNPSNEL
jgi:hypothetical protein